MNVTVPLSCYADQILVILPLKYVWKLKKNVFCLHFVTGQDSVQVEQACVFKVTFAPI